MDTEQHQASSERHSSTVPREREERDVLDGLQIGLYPLARKRAAPSPTNKLAPAYTQNAPRPSRLREARIVLRHLFDELLHVKEQLRSATAKHEAAAEQIERLTSELLLSEQAERERIAHLLHDDLQQLLVSLQMHMDAYSRSLSGEQAPCLGKVNRLITQTLDVTRTLTVDLSPPVLKGEDLTVTLDWLVLRMAHMHDLSVNVASVRPLPVPAHLHVLVYQLVRELLFNVVKHAGVGQARVHLVREEDRLVLFVEDEGAGFEAAAPLFRPAMQGGCGLHSVKERLTLLGGGFDVDTAPGKGTRITLVVPLKDEPADATFTGPSTG